MAQKVTLKSGSKKLVIDFRKIREEFSDLGFSPDGKLTEGSLTKMAEETAEEVISELNRRSSMREDMGSDSWYFNSSRVDRAVFNQPFSNAEVESVNVKSKRLEATITAPVTSTRGNTVDIFEVLTQGRPEKSTVEKPIYFPVTSSGSERLLKMRLGTTDDVRKIFRASKVRYLRKNGRIVIARLNYLPAIKKRDIVGVIARDIQRRLDEEVIAVPSLGITGKIKGLIKVK